MAHRFYTAFVLLAWLTSMGWLFVAKIWPTLIAGHPPDYSAIASEEAADQSPTAWRIWWKDRPLGSAVSQTVRRADGTAVRYVVQFRQMPLQMIVSESFGLFGSLLQPAVRDDESSGLDLLLATELRFDPGRRFTGFQTVADLADMPDFVRIRGEVNQRRKLVLNTKVGGPAGLAGKRLRHELDLPSQSVVQDAFAPRPELKNLQVGQKWTIPVYRPFPPNAPVQMIAAHAERHELLLWDGEDVETTLVVYHADAGAGLSVSREPIGREWVREDGLVLQHELRWSGTVIRLERVPDASSESVVSFLNEAEHLRLWTDD